MATGRAQERAKQLCATLKVVLAASGGRPGEILRRKRLQVEAALPRLHLQAPRPAASAGPRSLGSALRISTSLRAPTVIRFASPGPSTVMAGRDLDLDVGATKSMCRIGPR